MKRTIAGGRSTWKDVRTGGNAPKRVGCSENEGSDAKVRRVEPTDSVLGDAEPAMDSTGRPGVVVSGGYGLPCHRRFSLRCSYMNAMVPDANGCVGSAGGGRVGLSVRPTIRSRRTDERSAGSSERASSRNFRLVSTDMGSPAGSVPAMGRSGRRQRPPPTVPAAGRLQHRSRFAFL